MFAFFKMLHSMISIVLFSNSLLIESPLTVISVPGSYLNKYICCIIKIYLSLGSLNRNHIGRLQILTMKAKPVYKRKYVICKPLDTVFRLTGTADSFSSPYFLHISKRSFPGLLPPDTCYFPIPWYYFFFSLVFITPKFVSLIDFIHVPLTFFPNN